VHGKAGAGRELGKILMWNLQEKCWKKLDLLHNMQEVYERGVVFTGDWQLQLVLGH
jgi:hypothetical protein